MSETGQQVRDDGSECGAPRAHTAVYGGHAGPAVGQAASAAPGQGLVVIGGRYRVLELLGAGGMGVVYLAERVDDGKHVALKLMRDEFLQDAVLCERLRREARAVRMVAHPGVITLLDEGSDPSCGPYLAFEYLAGETLAERMAAHGAMPALEALALADEVLEALEAAHNAGVVHRDLKPENVQLVTDASAPRGERAVLLDFGISRIEMDTTVFGLSKLTRTGSVVGTAMYMPPEQALGERGQDARVDVYATGVVLYELLSARVPHPGENYNQVLAHVLNKDPESLLQAAPGTDPALAQIVHRAIARAPGERFETAGAFREALRTYVTELEQKCARATEPAPAAVTAGYTPIIAPIARGTGRARIRAALAPAVAASLAAALFISAFGAAVMQPGRAQASTPPSRPAIAPQLRVGYAVTALTPASALVASLDAPRPVVAAPGAGASAHASSAHRAFMGGRAMATVADTRLPFAHRAVVGSGAFGAHSGLRILLANPYRTR